MAGVWKRDGTVAVTNGSKKVTGTGTTFADTKNGVAKGHLFCITSGTSVDFYEVDYAVSNTELYLVQAYRGVTATGKAYEIITTFSDSVPEFARRLTATLSAYQQQSDAFQALLTSNAATIEVTAPDGTKQTLIPWKRVTSEGEGQATRAKAEADKAAASAAAAAAAVLAARLPTPDVSIPFTTDGRMTHGKGAPVLVGTTPVAQLVTYERLGSQTMIDKSGRLVTVPAGEMAIEQQGLAIFDQSVNLFAPSISWAASAASAAPWTHGAADAAGWVTVSGAGNTGATEGSYKDAGVLVKDIPHTFSMDVLKTPGLNLRLRSYGATTNIDVSLTETTATGSYASEVVTDMGSYWRIEGTRTFVNDTTRMFRFYPFGTNVGATGSMTYRRVQLEAKPFATPYIENATSAQTTRPATTRCEVPWPGNLLPITANQKFTMSCEFDIAGLADAYQAIISAQQGQGSNLLVRVDSVAAFLCIYRASSRAKQYTVTGRRTYKFCYRQSGNACDLFVDGVIIGTSTVVAPLTEGLPLLLAIGVSSTPNRTLNGHLRNINIWNSPLTDAQCVAASS
ncbi:LamG domain-containing protein [Aeromonas sp. MR16]|uniref:LamG domain-containing protein n=1 Tax=Aeromonas sp. MR16 TaxID=2923420 RepID=UPI001F4B2005|nr:LamG domain-containing protein [Aeromonas sp. MR16]MCH7369907.1 LamG domain-containing protein [Aeromonas sp. MR16]